MRGDRFRQFVTDPDIMAFFTAYDRDHTERLAEEWKRRGHDLRLGVGIATGSFEGGGALGMPLSTP